MPAPGVLDRALDLTDRHSLSHWDSMLIAACIEAGVNTLYTEDMGSPGQYDSVRLVNPFI
jgi:predicted nucleic acid-binding protein